MAYLNDEYFDGGLDWVVTNGTRLDICSQEPTTYGEATTDGAHSLGYKTGISIAAPSDRAGGGREVVVSAITDGVVTETDTATHYAITDGASILVAVEELSTPQAVTDGNVFTLNAFSLGTPDPA